MRKEVIGGATLYLGDCRELLPVIQADLVIADPPYNETSLAWDRWPAGWLDSIKSSMKPSASLWMFGSMRMFMERAAEIRAAEWKLAQDVVWEKHNGANNANDRFRRVHEFIVQFYRGEWGAVYKNALYSADATARAVRRKNHPQQWGYIGSGDYVSEDGGPRMMRSVWCCRSEHGRAEHPTQKPVGIVEPLIEHSCPPGGLIYDPAMGAGTFGIAALQKGRTFVGCEKSPEFFDIACRRIEESLRQEKLFA